MVISLNGQPQSRRSAPPASFQPSRHPTKQVFEQRLACGWPDARRAKIGGADSWIPTGAPTLRSKHELRDSVERHVVPSAERVVALNIAYASTCATPRNRSDRLAGKILWQSLTQNVQFVWRRRGASVLLVYQRQGRRPQPIEVQLGDCLAPAPRKRHRTQDGRRKYQAIRSARRSSEQDSHNSRTATR